MKKPEFSKVSRIRPGKTFWGVICVAGVLLLTRWLFDEEFFLNALYLLVLYLLVSFVYTYVVLDGILIERRSRYHRRQVGELFEENILVTNRSVLPVFWLQINDCSEISPTHSSRVMGLLRCRQTRMVRESSFLQ